ncbi:unnamed protein product [Rhizoctonia solani]|uniref:Uncharacterized protein n=1 Tax=Rhizoctonia solani TaxID=456999 RepID=A0A8H2WWC8_9AGAM|nr:unnamed protein product [Rhizoctonia solani]CAE6442727.1 unnamed protein product [Rhizoctonia solani]
MNSFMQTIRLLAQSSLVETQTGLPDVPMTTFRNSSSSPRSSIASSEVDLERGGVWSSEFPSPSASPSTSLGFIHKLSPQLITKDADNFCDI